jgi:hypothetical protein
MDHVLWWQGKGALQARQTPEIHEKKTKEKGRRLVLPVPEK